MFSVGQVPVGTLTKFCRYLAEHSLGEATPRDLECLTVNKRRLVAQFIDFGFLSIQEPGRPILLDA